MVVTSKYVLKNEFYLLLFNPDKSDEDLIEIYWIFIRVYQEFIYKFVHSDIRILIQIVFENLLLSFSSKIKTNIQPHSK